MRLPAGPPAPASLRARPGARLDAGHGGADRDRTDDPLLAKQVLSQLSYSPAFRRQTSEDRGQKSVNPAAVLSSVF